MLVENIVMKTNVLLDTYLALPSGPFGSSDGAGEATGKQPASPVCHQDISTGCTIASSIIIARIKHFHSA